MYVWKQQDVLFGPPKLQARLCINSGSRRGSVLKHGDIVVLDNLSSHKNKTARDEVRKVGARLFFLPPYSPDLNPIEMIFAKLKTPMRKVQERTVEACWKRVGEVLKAFSPNECSNYLRHAGYASNLS